MKLYNSVYFGAVALAISFGLFLWFAAAAGHAMDKSGIGDLVVSEALNAQAGTAFWVSVALWLFLLGFSLLRRGTERSQLLLVTGLAVVVAPVVWIIVIFFMD